MKFIIFAQIIINLDIMDHLKATSDFFKETIKPVFKYSTKRRLDILLDYVIDKSVLDLGCVEHEATIESKKNWWLHGLIKNKAKKVLGVDYDKDAVADLTAKGYNVLVGNVESLDLNETFDVVMAGELFEHLTNHRSFLDSVKRHLNKDGVFVASMPNANSLNYFMQTIVYGHEVDAWDHSAFFTPTTLSVMLKKCGFKPIEIIVYQPDEIFHHETFLRRFLAYSFNKIQQFVCWLKPSLGRGLIVVAKISD